MSSPEHIEATRKEELTCVVTKAANLSWRRGAELESQRGAHVAVQVLKQLKSLMLGQLLSLFLFMSSVDGHTYVVESKACFLPKNH